MSDKKATLVTIKENNKVLITTPPAVNLVVVGDHLEFDKSQTERGVVVGGI
jgi:hypothetical protein